MAHQVVTAKVREEVGKNRSASLRSEGLVPATIYGDQKDPISVSVNPRDLIPVYRGPLGKNTVISLQVENNGQTSTEEVISYKIDRDPISLEIKHVDFLRVTDKPVRAEVALKLTGSAPGVKLGGMMMQHISRVQIKAVPSKIPAFIEVSLSNLGVNQAIKVSELQNDDYEILTQGNVSIVTVTAKGKVEEETPGQGGKK